VDKFERFKRAHAAPPEAPERALMREVHRRIATAIKDAEVRHQRALDLDPAEVSRRLFHGGRLICAVSGEPVSPECFLDHHTVRFAVTALPDGKLLSTICSNVLYQ
jgi:hypothetical protein